MIPDGWCKDVVNWFDDVQKAGIVWHSRTEGVEKLRERDDEYGYVPSTLRNELLPQVWVGEYWDAITPCLNDYIAKYDFVDGLTSWMFKIHSVGVGQGYHVFHQEHMKQQYNDRVLAFMTYLNTPDGGGETEFLFQHKRCEPITGRTLIWPAFFTHLHRGNPVLKGRKVYLTGWYNYS